MPQPEPGKIFLHEGQIAVINEQQHLKMVMRTAEGRAENRRVVLRRTDCDKPQ